MENTKREHATVDEVAQTNRCLDMIKQLEGRRSMYINRLADLEKKIDWIKGSDDVRRFLEEFSDIIA